MPDVHHAFLEHSTDFDYKSIMIYSSTLGAVDDDHPLYKAANGDLIWMGGNADPELGRLSLLDIECVALLYPEQHVNRRENPPRKRSSDANALEVVSPSELTTTTGPVSTDFPRPANDSNTSQTAADAQVAKRWFSLPTSQEAQPGIVGLWPACGGDGRPHIVTYCFQNGHVWQQTNAVFLEALAKWSRAIIRSSLAFAPDPACTGGELVQCLCSAGVDEVTVHIMLSPDK
jgi:hypothetical protein